MPLGRCGGPRYAVGLTRVSTAEQGQSGLGLAAQQASVRAFVAAQGWTLVAEFSDIASGKDDRRPGFQAALLRCRQLGAVLVAARLDRITRRAHTLSQLLEDGVSIRAADLPGADDLMMRVYAALAQKERELISERTRAALAAAKARGTVLGGDRGYRPATPPCAAAAALARMQAAERAAHRLALEVATLRTEGVEGHAALARALTERGVPTPTGRAAWGSTLGAIRLAARVARRQAGGVAGRADLRRASGRHRQRVARPIHPCRSAPEEQTRQTAGQVVAVGRHIGKLVADRRTNEMFSHSYNRRYR